MRRLAVVLALLAAPAALPALAPAAAQAPRELGPAVGAHVPAFTLMRVDGAKAGLADIKGTKGVALVFFRSADWCPFCKKQLQDLNAVAPQMAAAGWPLVGASYDPSETLRTFIARSKLAYPLMTDVGSAAIDAFGIRNTDMNGNGKYDGIPHPVIFFIGADGVVRAKLYEESYRKRPPAELVLETAERLP